MNLFCISCIETDQNKKNDKKIDNKLKKWHYKETKAIRLLLLGSGESGKTTFVKQMKVLHQKGFTLEEKLEKIQEIKGNVFESIKELASNMDYLKPPIRLANEENRKSLDYIKSLNMMPEKFHFPPEFFEHVKKLWSDPGIKECYLKANEFSLIDSAKYFLDKIDEISKIDYEPSDQDVLRSRERTSKLQKFEFDVRAGRTSKKIIMYDVGGQCGERMKWCQAYNNIDAVLFVVDSSCFDTKLREKNKNRLEDSLELFEIIWFSKYLKESGIILFFNKQDILKEKIENGAKIEIFFPDYNDYQLKNNIKNDKNENPEYMKAKYFIRDKFMNITEKVKEQNNEYCKNVDFKRDEKPFFHFTTATDTENMEKIFKNVHLIRMINNLNFMYSP